MPVSFPMPPPVQQQRPILQRPQQPQFIQRQVAASYQNANSYRAQSMVPIPHGLPLQPVIGTISPVVYTLSSTRGPMNDKRPTMRQTNMNANPAVENGEAAELNQYDAKQLKDKNDFIDTQNQGFTHLVAQGISDWEAWATGDHALRRFTDAQRQNREEFVQAQTVRKNALSFHQNGAPGPKVFIGKSNHHFSSLLSDPRIRLFDNSLSTRDRYCSFLAILNFFFARNVAISISR